MRKPSFLDLTLCPWFSTHLGAGKTNIAMISVLREISQNMRYGVIQRADFKIVYVAPMKALAAEVTNNFSKRLEPLGESSAMGGG